MIRHLVEEYIPLGSVRLGGEILEENTKAKIEFSHITGFSSETPIYFSIRLVLICYRERAKANIYIHMVNLVYRATLKERPLATLYDTETLPNKTPADIQ